MYKNPEKVYIASWLMYKKYLLSSIKYIKKQKKYIFRIS